LRRLIARVLLLQQAPLGAFFVAGRAQQGGKVAENQKQAVRLK